MLDNFRGADVAAHDPLDDAELEFTLYTLGTEVEEAIVQTDHAVYADLTAGYLAGVRAAVDGRRIVRAGRFGSAGTAVLGNGAECCISRS